MICKLVDITDQDNILRLHEHKSRSTTQVVKSFFYQVDLPPLADRKWAVNAQPTSYYLSIKNNYLAQIFLVAGMIFTILLTLYLYFHSKQTKVIKQLVIDKTKRLHNANLKLKKLSQVDPLTGISNRRKMDNFLNLELA